MKRPLRYSIDRRIDICIVCHSYYPWDPRVRRAAECLIEEGYSVDILCLRDDGEPAIETIGGITVYRLPVKRHSGSNLLVYLAEYLAFLLVSGLTLTLHYLKKRYVLIQVHHLPDFLVFAALIPKLFGARIILDIRDVTPEFFASKYEMDKSSFLIKLIGWIEFISARFADHVVTATQSFKEVIASRGTPESKITVLMNAANEKLFDVRRYKNIQNLREHGLRLMYHGALNEQYDFDTLLGAVSILAEKIKDFRLDIFGSGPKLQNVKKRIQQLGINERVRVWGHVPQQEIPLHILSHDFGIIPSSQKAFINIAFPARLFEYIAMRRPVIASRRKSIEYYFDDSCVLVSEPSNAADLARCIEELYFHPEKAESLVSNATEVYQYYRWEIVKIPYCQLVAELCKNREAEHVS